MRRTRLLAVLASVVVTTNAAVPAHAGDPAGPLDGPPTATGADLLFTHPSQTLRDGTAQEAGLVPEYVDLMRSHLAPYLEPAPGRANPSYAGAVVIAGHQGIVVQHAAAGYALRYSGYAGGRAVELPRDEWVPVTDDTIFDMASVSKLFTSVATSQLIEKGLIDFDAPVVSYIPEFATNDARKSSVPVRQLLTHTSGMPSWRPVYRQPTYEARIAAVYAEPLEAAPGTRYTYSDLNLIVLGKIIERVTGKPLDQVVREEITEPLGMVDTGFNPPASKWHRVAATEYMPAIGRGIVRGVVHDENAWSLDGVAGHAGIFSTARDMAIFAQMLLNGGRYGSARILSEDSVRAIFTNENIGFAVSAARGRGFQLDQRFYMDALSSPVTAGHTGFTGTSIVIDPLSDSFVILLSNRVHPTRDWGTTSEYRRPVARDLARAIPVRPAVGPYAWFSGQPIQQMVSLTAPLANPTEAGRLSFRLWYDTATVSAGTTVGPDVGTLWASADGGASWAKVPFELEVGNHRWSTDGTFAGFEGRQWLKANAQLPDGTTHVRWLYQTRPDTTGAPEPDYQGRGVYVDDVHVVGRSGVLFNGERPADARRFVADGWVESSN